MRVWRLVAREIAHHRLRFAAGAVAVAVAVAVLVGSMVLLRMHDAYTRDILARKQQQAEEQLAELEDEMRRAMLKLSFNLVILPEDQQLRDWYARDYATEYMPEEYVHRLADSGIIVVRHFFPILQQKLVWPEKNRTIILVGTRGEVPNLHKNYRKPMVQPVPEGTIVLGHELHTTMDLAAGDSTRLMGREFTVNRCYDQRGNKDDITAWIHLDEAQEMLEKEDRINAILALECLCAGQVALPKVRAEIEKILPGTRVVERGTRALVRAEARLKLKDWVKETLAAEQESRRKLRSELERVSALLVPLVVVLCAVWIGLLTAFGVRDRRGEIGILRAMGYRSGHVMKLFVSKALLFGLLGGVCGLPAGLLGGRWLAAALGSGPAPDLPASELLAPGPGLLILAGACLLPVLAAWLPALAASYMDPASILRKG
ncbi:MAG: FtsX-like permease family protein [Candidatus Brocadiia bacterium]